MPIFNSKVKKSAKKNVIKSIVKPVTKPVKKIRKKLLRGFSTMELLMVLGITALLVSTVSAIYANLFQAKLKQVPLQLVEHIRLQQQRTCEKYDNTTHGVELSANQYTLFEGASYATRDQTKDKIYTLDKTISLCWNLIVQEITGTGSGGSGTNTIGSSTNEINFSTTNCNTPVSVGLISVTNQTEGTKTIEINSVGRVAYIPQVDQYCHCTNPSTALICEEVQICHHPRLDGGSSIAMCEGKAATIYVKDGLIVGGPDDGKVYSGTLNGTDKNDVIVGTANADTINGGKGTDVIRALGGNNIINENSDGSARIYAGKGNDTIHGGNKDNVIIDEGGNNTINGGNGKDYIEAGSGNDTINGGNGKDVIIDHGGTNIVNMGDSSGNGKDIVCTGNGNDTVNGGNGEDQIDTHGGTDIINGGHGGHDVFLNGENVSNCEPCSGKQADSSGKCLPIPECNVSYYEQTGVPVCHYPQNNMFERTTIYVATSTINAHLVHGDVLGTCEQDNAVRTMSVNGLYLLTHENHGDGIGACAEICHLYPPTIVDMGTEASVCSGGVSSLTFKYGGGIATRVKIVQYKGDTIFDQNVNPNEEFTVVGTDNGVLGDKITIYINGLEADKIYTNCSHAIGVGMTIGNLSVIAGTSKLGGPLCNVAGCSTDSGNVENDDNEKGKYSCDSEHKINICHIPPGNPANAHNICVDAHAYRAHMAHGDTLGGCKQVADANRKETIMVNQEDVAAHLAHGDVVGSCQNAIQICHEGQVIEINSADWPAYQAQGDVQGACPADPQIDICHSGINTKILLSQWPTHLAHGDTQGLCPENPLMNICHSGTATTTTIANWSTYFAHGDTEGMCPTATGTCGQCSGKVSELTFKYNGTVAAIVQVKQYKHNEILFNQYVTPGAKFTVEGTYNDTFGSHIYLYVNESLSASIHTSCGEPIGVGMVSGLFEITAGQSKNGGTLCVNTLKQDHKDDKPHDNNHDGKNDDDDD
ncbi:MAG: calcium-binding protein [Candidatus Falkowbacteria bacterium]|nr:calcium-binding protein [Candidatus Falkowbacteria bacterium]